VLVWLDGVVGMMRFLSAWVLLLSMGCSWQHDDDDDDDDRTFYAGESGEAFAGKWSFSWDQGSLNAASSCEEDEGAPTTFFSDPFTVIDLYHNADGDLVLSNGTRELVGHADENGFEVEEQFGESTEHSSSSYEYFEWVLEIAATVSGSGIEGDADYKEVDGNQSGECRFQIKQEFVGVQW